MTSRVFVSAFIIGTFVSAVSSGKLLGGDGVRQPAATVFNGDTNGDLERDISDAVYLLSHLFLGGPAPFELMPCDEAEPVSVQNGDSNGDGVLDVSDGVHLLGWLYSGGPEPASRCARPDGSGGTATSFIVPMVDSDFVPCANGGLGEDVNFSGNFHMVAAVTFDPAGGGHIQLLTNSQNVSGVGEVTGDTYQVTSVSTNTIIFPAGPLPLETEAQTVVNFIGRGSAVNFRVRLRFHLVITPNFDQPGGSRFFESTVECD